MDVKEAVIHAKDWLKDTLSDENPTNVGLEEVEFDEAQHIWKITLGFSRPWNTTRNALTNMLGETVQKRAYRQLIVNDLTHKIISMKKSSHEE